MNMMMMICLWSDGWLFAYLTWKLHGIYDCPRWLAIRYHPYYPYDEIE